MKRFGIFLLATILLVSANAFAEENEQTKFPVADARQLILVISENWDAVSAKLWRFEKEKSGSWRSLQTPIPVVLGRNGLAWGLGLHNNDGFSGPLKKEGDGKSPAGIFRLSSVFGLAEPEKMKRVQMPYRQLTASVECVDDVKSGHYNSIVDRKKISNPDWNSSEKMKEIGEQYRLGMVVDHNTDPCRNGCGSCIFLHIWKNSKTGTSGCTAMKSEFMETLVNWLDIKKNPILVQLPENEFKRMQAQWNLPNVN